MKTKYFPIGTSLVVTKKMVIKYVRNITQNYYRRTLIPELLPKEEIGQVVGGTYIQEGKVVSEHEGHLFDGNDYQPSYLDTEKTNFVHLDTEKTNFVYLVRLGFTNKPIMVLPEYAKRADYLSFIPFRFRKKYEWSQKDREIQRDEMKSVKRDSKGRWVK
jgi:hypothetical protein